MAIKKFKKKSVVVGLILVLFITYLSINSSFQGIERESYDEINTGLKLNSDNTILVNKVYNFTIDDRILDFDNNLFFDKHYYYHFIVAVVTPHSCDMAITVRDPELACYNISYEQNITQDDYRTIPFGTTLEGYYSVRFEATLSENLNVHIKIKRDIKCISDRIAPDDVPKTVHYNVSKFHDGETINFTCDFKSDWYYQFHFERVSTISKLVVNSTPWVVMDHDISSPLNITYKIYREQYLGYISYYFGTAINGTYQVNITIHCEVDFVNIAYLVVEKFRIADGIDPNNPIPPQPPDDETPRNTTRSGIEVYIPLEYTIGTLIVVGTLTVIPIVILQYRKRRNSTIM